MWRLAIYQLCKHGSTDRTGRFWSVDTRLQATKCSNDYFRGNTFEKLPITKLIDTAYRNGPIVVIDDDDEFDPRETTV